MLYHKPSFPTTKDLNGVVSVLTVTAATRTLTGIHIKNVKMGTADAHDEGYHNVLRVKGKGAGASTGALPEVIDKAKAKELTGDAFVEADFDAAAKDGVVGRDAFLKAVQKRLRQELFDKAGGDDLHHGEAGCTIELTEMRAITVSQLKDVRTHIERR